MEERQTTAEVHFFRNATEMIKRVQSFSSCEKDPPSLGEATRLFESFRAVHRLSTSSFSKVLNTGFLASLHCLQTHSKHADFAMMLPTVASMAQRYPKNAILIQEAVESTIVQQSDARELKQQGGTISERGGPQSQGRRNILESKRRWAALGNIPQKDIAAMKEEAENFLETMGALEKAQKQSDEALGIEHSKDRIFETNKMVFAVLGPHTLNYGEDKNDEHCEGVHLVFSLPALHHPDVFITPMAATFYHSGLGDAHRPWWATCQAKNKDPFESMLSEKLHPSSPLFHAALAWEFLGRVSAKEQKPLEAVSVKEMLRYLKEQNAHFMPECHLPYVTPLTLVESAIISEHSFAKLDKVHQLRARKIFGDRLKVVKGQSSKVQWEAAMAPISAPLPQSFAFTFLPTRTAEVVLPAVIKGNKGYIFFRASAPRFGVSLASGLNDCGIPQNQVTFTVDGMKCTATKGYDVDAPIVHDQFNRDLRFDCDAVMYCLELKRETFGGCSLTFRHAGVSQIWNREQVSLTSTHSLKTVIFTVRGALVAFTDVRVLYNEDYAYEYERTWEIPSTVQPPPTSVCVPIEQVSKEECASAWPWHRMKGYFSSGSDLELKPLCEHGMGCVAAFSTNPSKLTDEQQAHLEGHRHLCLFGQSCEKRECAEHLQKFLHLQKPVCFANPCDLLDDIGHRLDYHHHGYWDLLRPCRKGLACQDRSDPRHCHRYHHLEYDYYIDENGLRLVECNSKDRGLNDRHQSGRPGVRDDKQSASVHQGSSSSGMTKGTSDGHTDDARSGACGSQDRPNYDFSAIDCEVQDSVDDMGDIYNTDAMDGDYKDAELDQYGNPIGGGYDLAKDGAFKDFRVLIGCFYTSLKKDLKSLTKKELEKKGWEMCIVESVDEFTKALRDDRFHVAWIISNRIFEGNEPEFVKEVRKFHESGRGLMIWGDNDPYYAQANSVLSDLFDFTLTGNTPGGKELLPDKDPTLPGKFGKHLICSGIMKLHEGVTICYPTVVPTTWKVFGTSSNEKPVLLARDADNLKKGPGRVVVDNGFTKLMATYWTSAGTPRYVNNCCAWLALRERFKGPLRGFAPPPRT